MATATTSETTAPVGGRSTAARAHVQRFGTFLSGMIMPNIGAFIAWGLITAFFIEAGFTPFGPLGGFGENAEGEPYTGLVGPMITYLLPLLIAYTGGRMVYDVRGGVVGAIATMGVIVGTDIPMFIGAMLMGPLTAWVMKKVDAIWDGKIKPGFEMLVNNFSAGILAAAMAIFGFFLIGPAVLAFSNAAASAVDFLVTRGLLPLTSILIEPAKVLFLNNAINHGILTPLGTAQALEEGKSILFLLEANPGPGLGILLAYTVFGRGAARASAPGAAQACPNCNAPNPEDALFCEACGYDFTTGSMPRPLTPPDAGTDAPPPPPGTAEARTDAAPTSAPGPLSQARTGAVTPAVRSARASSTTATPRASAPPARTARAAGTRPWP